MEGLARKATTKTHFSISGTNVKNKTNIATAPTSKTSAVTIALAMNGETRMARRNGKNAIALLSHGTPTLAPQAAQVAGTVGPRHARRSTEMPGLLQ